MRNKGVIAPGHFPRATTINNVNYRAAATAKLRRIAKRKEEENSCAYALLLKNTRNYTRPRVCNAIRACVFLP